MENLKKHLFEIITAGLWLIFVVTMFIGEKAAAVGGLSLIAAIVMTVIAVKKRKKAKIKVANYPTDDYDYEDEPKSLLPESFSEDGKRYDLAYNYDDVFIVGRQYHEDVDLLPSERLYLLQEPTNQYDSEAVSVNVMRNGIMVVAGYLAQDSNYKKMVNDFYNRNEKVLAFVDDDENATMIIGFYK